uniref:Uncharacterized protein n=1 Tax=Oryza sativa subsp. japonica TaxID=39947 RepID=Q6YX60_ORYSJ|nr:hypothetical protein [Oryza sativa Japonica Group]
MATAKAIHRRIIHAGTSSSVPPQGGSSAKSKRQADINQEGLNLLGLEGFSTPPPRNNGQGAHSLAYQIKTLAPKASQMDFLFQLRYMTEEDALIVKQWFIVQACVHMCYYNIM